MKRIILTSAVVTLLTLSMSSCKKDYTCDCKDETGTQFDKQTYPNTSLTDAKRSCEARESFWKNGAQPGATCTIL